MSPFDWLLEVEVHFGKVLNPGAITKWLRFRSIELFGYALLWRFGGHP